ncbi:MAG TPA: hypothetical protein PLE74_13400 [Candidatus Cloacimonadota bacterium]|nr:hypothetical protein [Candidatus Cloacimonadota bacterium]
MKAIYATDLHGDTTFYEKLRSQILQIQPAFLFLGGDLFPNGNGLMALLQYNYDDFVTDFLVPWCKSIKRTLKQNYPSIFLIMGNDDSALEEINLRAHPELWTYCHNQCIQTNHFSILGYNCIPPSPFMNKDWERYDVSRFVDPGCVPPEEGHHSYPPDEYGFQKTIELELSEFDSICDFQNTICLFHSPPYNTFRA